MIKRLYKKISRELRSFLNRFLNKKDFYENFLPSLPNNFHELAILIFTKKLTDSHAKLGKKIENFRRELSQEGKNLRIHTFGSPRSNSQLLDKEGKVIPGDFSEKNASGVAQTGTSVFGGIQLLKLVEAFGGGRIIELGTNTGLSGCYFLSSPSTSELVTIEGSKDLCLIAEKNLARISDKFKVINDLFDNAIDQLSNSNELFNIAFIDGQHEKEATIFYTDKLLKILSPGAMIIYDDIYWSEGMNDAWNALRLREEFRLSIDLGTRGICILGEASEDKKYFSICDYIGKPDIYRAGW
jgi:predicted O-methyltransferase YrrM